MAVEILDVLTCEAEGCGNLASHISGLCDAHRRALKLSSAIQDSIVDFINANGDVIRPGNRDDKIIVLAGECLAAALNLLIGAVFDGEVIFCEKPIRSGVTDHDSRRPKWHVDLAWVVGSGI